MTPNELLLSWMLWLCVGFLVGYRYRVLEARDDLERKERKQAVGRLIARVGVACIERPTNERCN